MAEILDIIDEDGNLLGFSQDRKLVHEQGLLHHASGIILLNKINGQWCMLSQQRSKNKDKNAGLWDMSASGHVPSGQTPEESLQREIKEELGLNISSKHFTLLGKFWRNEAYNDGKFIENELIYIYALKILTLR